MEGRRWAPRRFFQVPRCFAAIPGLGCGEAGGREATGSVFSPRRTGAGTSPRRPKRLHHRAVTQRRLPLSPLPISSCERRSHLRSRFSRLMRGDQGNRLRKPATGCGSCHPGQAPREIHGLRFSTGLFFLRGDRSSLPHPARRLGTSPGRRMGAPGLGLAARRDLLSSREPARAAHARAARMHRRTGSTDAWASRAARMGSMDTRTHGQAGPWCLVLAGCFGKGSFLGLCSAFLREGTRLICSHRRVSSDRSHLIIT